MNIQTGEKLFEFRSKQDWINKASRIWRFHQVRSENTIFAKRNAAGMLVEETRQTQKQRQYEEDTAHQAGDVHRFEVEFAH